MRCLEERCSKPVPAGGTGLAVTKKGFGMTSLLRFILAAFPQALSSQRIKGISVSLSQWQVSSLIPCLTAVTILFLLEVHKHCLCYSFLTCLQRIGGTTACVVAGRLLAADPTLRILIVEAGPHTHNDLSHIQPARYSSHLFPNSRTIRSYKAQESEGLGGRAIVVQTGGCIGGGSSVNCTFRPILRVSRPEFPTYIFQLQCTHVLLHQIMTIGRRDTITQDGALTT